MINVKEWNLFSARHNSNNYKSSDGRYILKTSSEHAIYSKEDLEKEKALSDAILSLGLPTPKIFSVDELDIGGFGTIGECIDGKVSFSRAISEDDGKIDYYAQKLAKMGKLIHSTPSKGLFPSMTDRSIKIIKESDILNEYQRDVLLKVLLNAPKEDTTLHGDFQPANFIEANSKDYIIDIGDFSYGSPLFDLGFFYNFVYNMPDHIVEVMFHVKREVLITFWKTFIKAYYSISSEEEIKEKENLIKKYSLFGVLRTAKYIGIEKHVKKILDDKFDEIMS